MIVRIKEEEYNGEIGEQPKLKCLFHTNLFVYLKILLYKSWYFEIKLDKLITIFM